MSIRTGMARLASVIRGFGVIGGILFLCFAAYFFSRNGGGDPGTAVLTAGAFYGICWVIAYVIDGFARDDD